MKKSIFLIFLVFNTGFLLAQDTLKVTYVDKNDTLVIFGKQVYFSIRSNGGLTYRIKGHGSFINQKPYFIIYPANDTTLPKIIRKKRKGKISYIHLLEDNEPAIARLLFLDKKGKIVYTAQTNENGILTLPKNIYPIKLRIRDFMQNEFEINFDPDHDYEIYLPDYKIPQSKVILKIINKNDRSISYVLLADEFKKKINKRNLKKLEKKTRKKKKYYYIPIRNLELLKFH